MHRRFTTAALLLSLVACGARSTSAAPILYTTTTDLGGGLFAYDLVLHGQDDEYRSFFAQDFTFTGNLVGFPKWFDEEDLTASFVHPPWTENRMGAPVQSPGSYKFSAGTGGGSQFLSLPLAHVVVAGDLSITGIIGRGGLTYELGGSFSTSDSYAAIESMRPPSNIVLPTNPPDLPPVPGLEELIDEVSPPANPEPPTEPETPAEQEPPAVPQPPQPPSVPEVIAPPEVVEPVAPVDVSATDPPADIPPPESGGGDESIPAIPFPVIIIGPPKQIWPIEGIGDWQWTHVTDLRRDLITTPSLGELHSMGNGDFLIHTAYTGQTNRNVTAPEPATWMLAATALAMLGILAPLRRRLRVQS